MVDILVKCFCIGSIRYHNILSAWFFFHYSLQKVLIIFNGMSVLTLQTLLPACSHTLTFNPSTLTRMWTKKGSLTSLETYQQHLQKLLPTSIKHRIRVINISKDKNRKTMVRKVITITFISSTRRKWHNLSGY